MPQSAKPVTLSPLMWVHVSRNSFLSYVPEKQPFFHSIFPVVLSSAPLFFQFVQTPAELTVEEHEEAMEYIFDLQVLV